MTTSDVRSLADRRLTLRSRGAGQRQRTSPRTPRTPTSTGTPSSPTSRRRARPRRAHRRHQRPRGRRRRRPAPRQTAARGAAGAVAGRCPGNHDIGDVDPTPQPIDDTRRARYADAFGASRWITEQGGWRLVGIDAQTLLSELPAAADEWQWLAGRGDGRRARRPVPAPPAASVARRHARRAAALRLRGRPVAPRRAARRLDGPPRRDAATCTSGGMASSTAPPTCGPRRRGRWSPIGCSRSSATRSSGWSSSSSTADGTVRSTFVRPDGVTDLRIGDDFPSPYEH